MEMEGVEGAVGWSEEVEGVGFDGLWLFYEVG